jgi:hypothetical protein
MDYTYSKLEIIAESVYDYSRIQDADILTNRPVFKKSIPGRGKERA